MVLITAVIFFTACNKNKDDLRPPIVNNPPVTYPKITIAKELSNTDGVIQVPSVKVTSSATVSVGAVNGAVLLGGNFKFNTFGSFNSSRDVKNFTFKILDTAASVIYTSPTYSSVINGVNSFQQMGNQLPKTKTYTFKFEYEVMATATDGTGPDDGEQLSVTFYYSHQNSSYDTLGPALLQTHVYTTTSSSTLQTSLDPLTPGNQTITGNQEIKLLTMKLKSVGGASILDKQTIQFSDANAAAIISLVNVYDTASSVSTFIGSGIVSGQTAIVNLNLNLPENVEKTFLIKAVIGNITLAASGSKLSATSDKITYKDAGGMQKTNDVDIVGNIFTLLKATQIITSVPLSGNLQNNTLTDGNKVTVLSKGGNSSTKQLTYKVVLTDNAPHVNLLSYKNFYLKVGGAVMTNVRFENALGQVIDSIGPGENIVRVTFFSGTHAYVNPVGTPIEYIFGGRFTGYTDQTTDGDVGSIELILVDNPTSYRFVNSGVGPDNLTAKLFSSPTANAGAVVQNYAWFDMSSGSAYSAAFGNSSADAKNAAVGIEDNTQKQTWQ